MNDFIAWVVANGPALLAAAAAVYAAASAIAAVTPTDTDNKILAKIGAFARRVGLDLTKQPKK